MSALRRHLLDKARYQRDRIRSGLRLRFDRQWDPVEREWDDPFDASLGVTFGVSPRRRLHHGIRKGIRNLRKLRGFLAELDGLHSSPRPDSDQGRARRGRAA